MLYNKNKGDHKKRSYSYLHKSISSEQKHRFRNVNRIMLNGMLKNTDD